MEKLRAAIAATPGVVAVAPAKLNPAGNVATITVYPHSSPQAYATTQLVERLREQCDPAAEAHTGMAVYVGGVTAGAVDFATTLGHKLPLFIGVVVLLSALLLMIVFRSLVIPLQAAVMNLLRIGASLGVIVAIFQWGWFGGLFGVQQGPIESFIPVMLFAIVFGLSMDYEVFLISRMHERWVHTGDDQRAVQEGLALTGRVVTAAAAIMVCVFLSFMLGEDRIIKEFGLSLASAVFLDALVIRCLLLPAVLTLVGARTWQIPAGSTGCCRASTSRAARSPAPGAHEEGSAAARLAARAARGGHRGSGRLSRLRGGASAALACAALLLARCGRAAGMAFPAAGSDAPIGRPSRPWSSSCPERPVDSSRALRPPLSTGIMSAAQGSYTTAQLLLDITQGSRVSTSAYSPQRPPALSLQPRGTAGAVVEGWQAVAQTRARRAAGPRTGAARIADPRRRRLRGDRRGNATSTESRQPTDAARSRRSRSGSAATLPARIAALSAREQLVVADLPPALAG